MDKEKYLVSVIIPTYKRSDFLVRAMESVLKQTYSNIQIVVVDDNDPSSEYRKKNEITMKQYENNTKIKYVKHKKNMNGSVARNTGIEYSDGEIITFLDDDDVYKKDKVEKELNYLLNSNYKAVYCGWIRDNKIVKPVKEGNLTYDILSGDNIIYTNAIMMWKDIAQKCGGWNTTFRRHQEAAFLLNYFGVGGQIGVVPEELVIFDVSDRSNEAANPYKNEEYTLHFLSVYEEDIKECRVNGKKMSNKIYSHRYRGILLNYIKSKKIIGAVSFYFRKCIRLHFIFIYEFIVYLIKKKWKE